MAIAESAINVCASQTSRMTAVRYDPMAKTARMTTSSPKACVTALGHGVASAERSTISAPITRPTPNPNNATSERTAAAPCSCATCSPSSTVLPVMFAVNTWPSARKPIASRQPAAPVSARTMMSRRVRSRWESSRDGDRAVTSEPGWWVSENFELCFRCLCPVGHGHVAERRPRRRQARPRAKPIAHSPIERAEAQMALGYQRAHAERLAEADRALEVRDGAGLCFESAARSDFAEQTLGGNLRAPLAVTDGVLEATSGECRGLDTEVGLEIALREVDQAQRLRRHEMARLPLLDRLSQHRHGGVFLRAQEMGKTELG